MKPGGGKAKGATFERAIGVELSRWLTQNQKDDLFTRNVLSGGKYTQAQNKGLNQGIPGDLLAAHPLAFKFQDLFVVECKHYAKINLGQYFYSPDLGWLPGVIETTTEAAYKAKKYPFVIIKEDRRPTILILDRKCGQSFLNIRSKRTHITYHWMNNQKYLFVLFHIFLFSVESALFLNTLENL